MWTVVPSSSSSSSSFITTSVTIHLFIVFSNYKFLTARRLPTVYWNSSNPLFTDSSRFPNDAEIGAGAAFVEVDAMDSMDIVCPTYSTAADKYEQLIIYQVSDLSFMSCELDSRSQAFLVCDSPRATTPITHKIVFRQFSPLPNGFEYQPGRSYYLISTSNGSEDGMNNTRLGLCVSANMRLRIDVRPLGDQIYPKSEEELETWPTVESEKAVELEREGRLRSSNMKLSREDDVKSEQTYFEDVEGLNNESQKFAEKHGFDMSRLEYVRQLAIDGVEGDFSFRELENDSRKALRDSTEASLTSGPGRPQVPGAVPDRETRYHSTGRQAQRWISKEKQNRFGAPREPFSDEGSAESVLDYVVDDLSGGSTTVGCRRVSYAAFAPLLLLWVLER